MVWADSLYFCWEGLRFGLTHIYFCVGGWRFGLTHYIWWFGLTHYTSVGRSGGLDYLIHLCCGVEVRADSLYLCDWTVPVQIFMYMNMHIMSESE